MRLGRIGGLIGAIAISVGLAAQSAWANVEQFVQTQAEYAVIMDNDTGDVLFSKNADERMYPASMSKLMTILLLFERLKDGSIGLEDEFYVSEKAWSMQGSKMWVLVDTRVKVKDLLRGIIVQSGNDACIVVAESLGGTEDGFADMMNEKARELGMRGSHFTNSTGWPDPEHYTTARDLAVLARELISNYPDYYAYFSEREFTWSDIRQPNRNPLIYGNLGADGLKTGHTEASGYGLVGSAERDGERRIIVVNGLGSENSRASEGSRLLRVALADFERKELFKSGEIIGEADVWKGEAMRVPLRIGEEVSAVVHRRAENDLVAKIVYEGPIAAPIAEDSQVAVLRLEAPGRTPQEFPLFAASAIGEISFLGKLGMGVSRLLSSSAPAPAEPAATEVPLDSAPESASPTGE